MNSTRWSRWRVSVLVMACAFGATLAYAAAPAGRAGRGAAPAATVTPANKAAALEHFQKAKDLHYNQNKTVDANAENDIAMQLDPTNNDLVLFKKILQDKIAQGGGGTTTTGQATAAGKMKTLNAQQISVIRFLEAGETELIRGTIPRKVLDEFWENVAKKDVAAGEQISQQAYLNFVNPAKSNYPDSIY